MVEEMRILGLVGALRGKEIEACLKVPYKGCEISFSTRDGKPELRIFDEKDKLLNFQAFPGNAEDLKAAFKFVDTYIATNSAKDLFDDDRVTITAFAMIHGMDVSPKHEVYAAAKKAACAAYHRNLLTMDEKARVNNLYMNFMREVDAEVPDLALRAQYRRAIYRAALKEQENG